MVLIQKLNLTDKEKDVLAKAGGKTGITIPQAAATIDIGYSAAWQRITVWVAKGWLKKHKTLSGDVVFLLNKEEVQLVEGEQDASEDNV